MTYKSLLTVLLFLLANNFSFAQCGAVSTAATLESCLEAGTSVTLVANISITGLTITIPNGATATVNVGTYNITWTGSPWALANPGNSTVLTFTNGSASIGVVKNAPSAGQITMAAFNAGLSSSAALPALPIELSSFSARAYPTMVLLEFATASERNNKYFSIEHSVDGLNFKEVGQEQGAGDSYGYINYSYKDLVPQKGINYYRLKQIDFDGQFSYSRIVSVVFGNKRDVNISPSPVFDDMKIQLVGDEETMDAMWEIVDVNGRTLLSGNKNSESNTLQINTSSLQKGDYFLRIVNSEQAVTKHFLKL